MFYNFFKDNSKGGEIMVGAKIRERRQELGLTQQQLAELVGYTSKSTINKIENDVHDVNQTMLVKIADALKVSPTFFLETSRDSVPSPAVSAYAEKFLKLSPEQQHNVIQYIDFLLRE